MQLFVTPGLGKEIFASAPGDILDQMNGNVLTILLLRSPTGACVWIRKKIFWSAEYNSDHNLLCARFALRKRFYHFPRASVNRHRFDVAKLSQRQDGQEMSPLQMFQQTVRERLEAGCSPGEGGCVSVSGLWSTMRNALTESAKELLGHRHRVHPDWFLESRDSLQPLVDVQNQCYNDWLRAGRLSGDELHMKFKSVRSAARTALRRAKNTWFQTYAKKLQTSRFDSVRIWACVRLFQSGKGGYASTLCPPVRLETGDLCDSADEQVQRWHRHFTSFLRLETSFHPPVIDAYPNYRYPQYWRKYPQWMS